ncbi:MAG: hypothetical protein HOY79_03245 [Streptomyces sp.]|nr:hypothetical protein [Streptomyces sp.]
MSQPTETTSIVQSLDSQRPAVMAALALAEHLTAAPVPMPWTIEIRTPLYPSVEAVVRCYAHRDLSALFAWQTVFGGEIMHTLHGDRGVHSCLAGRAYDAPFEVWTLRDLNEEQQATERQITARWCAEHGAVNDWCTETRDAYRDALLQYRLEVAL